MNKLRPLNQPVPIVVETGADGEPAFITWRGRRIAVDTIVDRWQIEDEWWRDPVARLYRRLLLFDERLLTVFEDLLTGRWYAQHYRYGIRVARERRVQTRTRRSA